MEIATIFKKELKEL